MKCGNNFNNTHTGEMDIIGEHTILCTQTSINNTSRTHTNASQVSAAQAQTAHLPCRRKHETTTTASVW